MISLRVPIHRARPRHAWRPWPGLTVLALCVVLTAAAGSAQSPSGTTHLPGEASSRAVAAAKAQSSYTRHYDPAYRRQGQTRARPELAVVGIASLADAALERAADQVAAAVDALSPS